MGICFNSSLRFRRQLKNCSLLAFTYTRQEHDLTVRKFQRIVMSGNPIFVDLPKDRRFILDRAVVPRPKSSWQALNLVSKS